MKINITGDGAGDPRAIGRDQSQPEASGLRDRSGRTRRPDVGQHAFNPRPLDPAGRLAETEGIAVAGRSEAERLRTLSWLGMLDPPAALLFDDLAAMAAQLCETPIAVVSLVDTDRHRFTARVGIALDGTPREGSFCDQVLMHPEVMVVADARADERFVANPLVTADPFVRFYAGAPLVTSDGQVLGTLCVMDTAVRDLSPDQHRALTMLAKQVISQLELRHQTRVLTAEIEGKAQVQEGLSRSQQVLDGVLDYTDVLIYAKDLTGCYILANRALERALDLDGGLRGGFDVDLFPTEVAESYRANDAVILVKRDHQVFDEELIHSDGTAHLYRSTKFPLLDEQDQVYAIAGVSTDVTELMAARAAHQEAELRWRSLVERSPVAVAVIGADQRFAYANPTAMVLLGVDFPEHIEGRAVLEFAEAQEQAELIAVYGSVARGGSAPLGRRWHLVQAGGAPLTVEVYAAAINYLGKPALQVELRDVTVTAAAEEAIRDSEHRFHALFNGSPVAMALSDGRGVFVDANAAFGALLGVEPAEMIGHPAQHFAHPDDHALIERSEMGQLNSRDGVFRAEVRFLRPDGGTRWTLVAITPTPGPAGQTWTLAVVQDITARKAAEDALRESESDLAAIAAVARCLQAGEDPRPVVVKSVLELAGAFSVTLLETVGTGGFVATAAAGGEPPDWGVPLSEQSTTTQVWRTGQPMYLSADRAEPMADLELLDADVAVVQMWQPVIVHGTVRAILDVTWRDHPVRPGDRAIRSVRVIADEAGASLNATRLRAELERSALTDPLTGSLNRRAWDLELAPILEKIRSAGGVLTIALIDLDHFKFFNDTRGHNAGDVLLQEFVELASRCLRAGDVFARWGGEEFIIALPQTSPAQAADVLDRVRNVLPPGSTCSVGQTMWHPNESLSTCIARADLALYDAKRSGRNRLATR